MPGAIHTPKALETQPAALNHEINEILQAAEVRERRASLGIEPLGGTSAEFAAFHRV
jgi:tripartite-type tricarboxylate transporter receptor subunit TctC